VLLLFFIQVKKVITILTAVFLVTSGMHVNLSSHYCEGNLIAVRLSVTGEKATCGMEACLPEKNSGQNTYRNNCCEDHVSAFSLGYYENTASLELSISGQNITHLFGTPCFLSMGQEYIHKITDANLGPPGIYCPESLSCPTLCVFRI
jgi:hypothetical protein